jgi:hypothetical protein
MAERNLDFKEAKSKGLIAPNAIAEQEVLKLAGGESAFRPESWWNEQLTRQVNNKNFQKQTGTKLQLKSTGILGMAGNSFQDAPVGMAGRQQRPQSNVFGKQLREGIDYRYVPTYGDSTIETLKAITSQSKKSVQDLQRQSGEMSARNKRISRAVGGLLAGVKSPSLGESQTTGPVLGADTMLGVQSSLGSRRRT